MLETLGCTHLVSIFVCIQVAYMAFPLPVHLKLDVIVPLLAIGFVTVSLASVAFLQSFAAAQASWPQQDFMCLIRLPVEDLSLVSR